MGGAEVQDHLAVRYPAVDPRKDIPNVSAWRMLRDNQVLMFKRAHCPWVNQGGVQQSRCIHPGEFAQPILVESVADRGRHQIWDKLSVKV